MVCEESVSELWEKALQSVRSFSILKNDLNIPKVQMIDSSLYSEIFPDGK